MSVSELMARVPMAKVPYQSEFGSRYGLEAHEWDGSLSDRVMTIINKNDPAREDHVNALLYDNAVLLEKRQRVNDFLRDQVAVFEIGMEKLEAENATYNDMGADACVYGYDLRDSIKEAVENGILINAETMNAIKRVEHNYVEFRTGLTSGGRK